MNQLCLFDAAPVGLAPPSPSRPALKSGEQLKREGMAVAAESRESLLAHARSLAHHVAVGLLPHADGQCRADGLCTMDDVAAAWAADAVERERAGMRQLPSLGNAAGSVFSGDPQAWEFTGQFFKSQRPIAHSNLLRVWRYRGNAG